MKVSKQKINVLAKQVFDKMLLDGYTRGLALAITNGVTVKNVLEVNNKVDDYLIKWRGEQ